MKSITEYSKLTIAIALLVVFIVGAVVVNQMKTSQAKRDKQGSTAFCIKLSMDSGYTAMEALTQCQK